MKNILTLALSLIMLNLFLLSSCKKDDPQPETARVRELLKANTWLIQTVTVDEVNKTNLFTGLTLSFTNTTYATTNGGLVWPASGTWQFADKTGKLVTRDDGLQITINEVSKTSLSLSLTWNNTTLGSGRISSLAGDHEFIFVKD